MESSFLNPSTALYAAGVHEGMKVADFGASSGFFARAAARLLGPRGVVWAVDSNQDLLKRIANLGRAEGLRTIEIIRGNVEKAGGSNLPERSIDVVIVANLLFSIEHKQRLVQEVARVLRPGGSALVIDWSDSHGGLGPHPDHILTVSEARKLFEEEGFAHVKDVPAGQYHWGFLVRKK